jgi:hypothetical protein
VNQLLVIGELAPDSKAPLMSSPVDIDAVAATAIPGLGFGVARCTTPAELVRIVQTYAHHHGLIDILDLYYHGTNGLQAMGDDVLFESDADPDSDIANVEIARALADSLTPRAFVRLLGCKTALEGQLSKRSGRFLLVKLARELGERRVVFGTNSTIFNLAFDQHGFRRDQEIRYLYSSLAAIDGPCPDDTTRLANIGAIRKTVATG